MQKIRFIRKEILIVFFMVVWILSSSILANLSTEAKIPTTNRETSQNPRLKQNSPPFINITEPEEGESIELLIDSTITINWTANDPDNDSLVFDVAYSKSGADWSIISENISRTWYDLYARNLSRGNVMVRVTAKDGFYEVSDTVSFVMVKLELISGFEMWTIMLSISSLIILVHHRKRKK